MTRAARISLGILALMAGLIASAQTVTYSINPGSCPTMADIPMVCGVYMSPANDLGFPPLMTVVDDLSNSATNGGTQGGNNWRLIEFETTPGPNNCGYAYDGTTCYLGNADIQVNAAIPYGQEGHYRSYPSFQQFCASINGPCITDVAALSVYFEGQYTQDSGYGKYIGVLTEEFAYSYTCTVRFGCQNPANWHWHRRVTGGAVTISPM